tara:strand:- start:19344 stop:21740 length:2397 start_codon:yes stop_codon:yes gene_type:complete
MEKLTFTSIHNLIIEVLEISDNKKLEIIGLWYFNFLKSDETEVSLKLPEFELGFSKLAYDYIRNFTLAFNLLNKEEILNFENTCLFDFFNYKKKQNNPPKNYVLPYNENVDEIIKWGSDTIVDKNRFLPVFNENQICTNDDCKNIYDSLQLLKALMNKRLIKYPVLIDLEEDLTLVFDCFNKKPKADEKPKELILEKTVFTRDKLDKDTAAEKEEELLEENIKYRINLKYPNAKEPHSYLLEEVGIKRFNLIFNNRFYISEENSLKNDIILLPNEYVRTQNQLKELVEIPDFEIIQTNHNQNLFYLLKELKESWKNLNLNKYQYPFPKYWFLFINPSLSKTDWINQFIIDYPAIESEPIIKKIESIISELHDLNWFQPIVSRIQNDRIYFPELKSVRKKRLETIFDSFKYYYFDNYPHLKFINHLDSLNADEKINIVSLNAFDIFDIINLQQDNFINKVTIFVPDFMFYCYNPWVKNHLFINQSLALQTEMRKGLDANFVIKSEKLNKLDDELRRSAIKNIKGYRERYLIKEEELTNEIEELKEDDIEFLPDENEEVVIKRKKGNKVTITTKEGEQIVLKGTEQVLVQRDYVLYKNAESLIVGDLFLLNSDLNELLSNDSLFDKLSEIPDGIKDFQSRLFNIPKVYNVLKRRNISYKNEYHFKTRYLISAAEFVEDDLIIPRRKADWEIICNFLSIDSSEMNLAYISYYGRKKEYKIKELYKLVVELFVKKGFFGYSNSEEALNEIENILKDYQDIFSNGNEDFNLQELAESISVTLVNELVFKEIKNITIASYEQVY